jgi:hypothetical protein
VSGFWFPIGILTGVGGQTWFKLNEILRDAEPGKRSLIVFYCDLKDNFDIQIEKAIAYHQIADENVTIIAVPESLKGKLEVPGWD